MKSSDALQAGLILVCGVTMTVTGRALQPSQPSVGAWGLERLLGMGLSIGGVVIVAVWLLALAAALVAELLQRQGSTTASRVAGRCTPAVMRRLAAAVLGVNLLAVPAMAQAAPGGSGSGSPSTVVAGSAVTPEMGLTSDGPTTVRSGASADAAAGIRAAPYWSPQLLAADDEKGELPTDRSSVSPAWKPAPIPADGGLMLGPGTRTALDDAEVVVSPGDSLWSIVATQLGPLATAADVAEAWPAWYGANRTTIGDDPSLLIPGQVLLPPTPSR